MSKIVETYTHVYFYGGNCLSNWYPSVFKHLGFEYSSSEQAMMHRKALLMGDLIVADDILKTDIPEKQKALGRKIKNYNEEYWSKVRYTEVVEILKQKFLQNKNMLEFLHQYQGKTFVEASPYDKIWGIGLGLYDDNLTDLTKWKGTNLLGEALTEVSKELFIGRQGTNLIIDKEN